MPEQDFASLARVTLNAARLADEGHDAEEVLLWATLQRAIGSHYADGRFDAAAVVSPQPRPTTSPGILTSLPWGRLIVALVIGLALGVLGCRGSSCPSSRRLRRPSSSRARSSLTRCGASVSAGSGDARLCARRATDRRAPLAHAVTSPARPTSTPTAVLPQVAFGEPLLRPLPNWPNKPDGTAGLAADGFRLFARESGRFVASAALAQPLSSAVLTARFHKVADQRAAATG